MAYTVERADLVADRQELLALWKRNHVGGEERFRWIYERNPAGQPTCFLARDGRTSKLVGCTTLFPRPVYIQGRLVRGGIAGDFAVDKEHRLLGPALMLQRAAVAHCDGENFQILYGNPNSRSEAVLRRVGYKKVAPQLQLTKPIRSRYYLARRVRPWALSHVLSKPLDLALKVSSRDVYFKHPRNTEFHLSSSFDERFDRLWMRSMNSFTIIGCRSSDYLRWKFEMAPSGNYRIFTLSDRTTTELDGYIVFSQNENSVTISDLFVANTGNNLDTLLAGFITGQREEGADFISLCYAGSPQVTRSLLKFGFSLRGSEGGVHCYTTEDLDISAVTGREENWYLFSGDYDA